VLLCGCSSGTISPASRASDSAAAPIQARAESPAPGSGATQPRARDPISSFFWALDDGLAELRARAAQAGADGTAREPTQGPEVPKALKQAATASVARPRQQARAAAIVPAPKPRPPETTSSTRFPNPLAAYEEGMLRRDARTMARAAAQLTDRPVTETSIRTLNQELGIEADDGLVEAIARAAR
jgi:hypothetical protein